MKTKLLKFTAFLLIIAGWFASCGKENNGPVEIPFTEYSLAGTLCQWTNLGYNDKVIIINSSAALENYLTNTGSSYPIIDFSKQTLLLASGTTTTGIAGIAKKLQQISTRYVLDIEITLNEATFAQEWIVALVTSKLNESKNIELNVTNAYGETDYPIEVPLREYSLNGTSCQWKDFESNKAIIISSDEELRDYIICTGYNYPEIDFSVHSLVLVRGMARANVVSTATSFFHNGERKYTLNVTVYLGPLAVMQPWAISILTPKIPNSANIVLVVDETDKI